MSLFRAISFRLGEFAGKMTGRLIPIRILLKFGTQELATQYAKSTGINCTALVPYKKTFSTHYWRTKHTLFAVGVIGACAAINYSLPENLRKRNQVPLHPATWGIVLTNAAACLLTARRGALLNKYFVTGRYQSAYTQLTSVFGHSGVVHMALNTFAAVSVLPSLEDTYGSIPTFLTYLTMGVGASYFSVMMWHNLMIGSSGAVIGLFGLSAGKASLEKREERLQLIFLPGFTFTFNSYLKFEALMALSLGNISPIAHLTHFAGGSIGYLLGQKLSLPQVLA